MVCGAFEAYEPGMRAVQKNCIQSRLCTITAVVHNQSTGTEREATLLGDENAKPGMIVLDGKSSKHVIIMTA